MDLTLDEVSSQVGFSKPYLSTIERGKVKNPPSDELLTQLEEILDFEPGLLQHIAQMERIPADIRQKYETTEAENQRWRQIIKNLMDAGGSTKKIKSVLSKSKVKKKQLKKALTPGQLIPVINKTSAGYPADFHDLDYPAGIADDYVRCPDVHDPNAFAIRVVGDSMEPKYREGDIVIFAPSADVRNGDDCFIRFKMPHETAFKRVFFEKKKKVRLQPRNENYSPVIMEGKRIDGIYRAIIKYEKL